MAVLLQAPYNQFLDDDGNPLTGGFVYTYEAGTDTPKATYTSYTGTIEASNPVELDAAGRADIWVQGNYKITVTNSDGVIIRTVDHIEVVDQGGDMTKAVYDPANIAQQLVGTTAVQAISNKTFIAPVLGVASATSINFGQDALNYYDQGTFTPVASGSGTAGTGTYTTQVGRYTRIGDRVDFRIQIGWSAHTGTGNLNISGLPFTNSAVVTPITILTDGLTIGAGIVPMAAVASSSQGITLYALTQSSGSLGFIAMDTVVAGIYLQGTYFV